ncbi:MAG: hypothetical protein AAGK66_02735 [Pseudomonadota bacterium]
MLLTLTHNQQTYTGFTIDALTAAGVPDTVIDTAITARFVERGNAAIDAACDLIYTASTSRSQRYARKYEEAVRYRDADYPGSVSQSDYPFLVAEAAALGITKRAQADAVIARGDAFAQVGALAEASRAALEKAVEAATGHDAKQAAYQSALADFQTQLSTALQGA